MRRKALLKQHKRAFFILFVFIFIAVLIGAYTYYRQEAEKIRQVHYETLHALARLKVDQIVQWRKERISNALILAQSPLFSRLVEAWRRNPKSSTLKNDLIQRLNLMKDQGGYEDAILVDSQFQILYSIDPHVVHLDPQSQTIAKQALSKDSAVMGDFYRCSIHGRIHIDIAAAVAHENSSPSTILILRSDPEAYLFPLIQSWPTPSPSSETLLVRKEGDNVLLLNRLRHSESQPLSIRFPLSRTEIPAVRAVSGKTGLFNGIDYRGVQVMAEINPVPDSSWAMVAKVDIREINSEAIYRAAMISGISGLLILLAAAILAFIYSRKESAAIAESEERFRTTIYSIGDGVITTDTEGRIRQMNTVAEKLTGWREAEAANKPIEEIFRIVNEETRNNVENPVPRVIREGKIIGLANHTILIASDGTEHPIADSGSPI
ncbi:MAG: PAS domain S-box protein, partial [Thermodesulfobacteriota bacterium]